MNPNRLARFFKIGKENKGYLMEEVITNNASDIKIELGVDSGKTIDRNAMAARNFYSKGTDKPLCVNSFSERDAHSLIVDCINQIADFDIKMACFVLYNSSSSTVRNKVSTHHFQGNNESYNSKFIGNKETGTLKKYSCKNNNSSKVHNARSKWF